MNAGQKSAKRIAASTAYLSRETVCSSCFNQLTRQSPRHAATAAATAVVPPQPEPQHVPPVTSTAPAKAYRLLASPVVSRPPLLTRSLNSFEKAFYLYQKRLNERLALPFTRYFYYKKGTPADAEWKRKALGRKTAARDIGVYSAYDSERWNDEVLVGDQTAEPEGQVEALIRDAEAKLITDAKPVGDRETGGEKIGGDARDEEDVKKDKGMTVERPMPKWTEADEANDLKSLNRRLDRSLYLLVKNKEGRWRFPEDRVFGRENMHEAAERILVQACGLNMNTWVVGNHPIGHYAYTFQLPTTPNETPKGILTKFLPNPAVSTSTDEIEQEEFGEKVFFMKTRIMAGQADLTKNIYGDQDFVWALKEEVEERVTMKYWSSVRNMLTER